MDEMSGCRWVEWDAKQERQEQKKALEAEQKSSFEENSGGESMTAVNAREGG